MQPKPAAQLSERERKLFEGRLKLSKREQDAFDYFCRSNLPEISPITQVGMFELWLNGKSIEDIRKLYGNFSLGQVAHAAVIGEWHVKKEDHVETLLSNVVQRVQQTSLESISYVCDWISVHHKQHGDKMAAFFKTGDTAVLEGLPHSIQAYANGVQLLRSLTGQDKTKAGSDLPPYRVAPGMRQDQGREDNSAMTMPNIRPNSLDQNTHSRILEALDVVVEEKKK